MAMLPADYQDLLRGVAEIAVPALGDFCVVYTQEREELQLVAFVHADRSREAILAELLRSYPPDASGPGPVRDALCSGRSVLLAPIPPDLLAQRARDAEHLRLLRELGPRSIVLAPLVARGTTLGLIVTGRDSTEQAFGPEDVARVEVVARGCALVLDDRRLREAVERAEREARALYHAALAIGGDLDLDTRLGQVLDAALELVGVNQATLALVDQKHGEIEIVAVRGVEAGGLGLRMPVGQGNNGFVAAHGRPLRIADITVHPNTWRPDVARAEGTRSWLGVPLADGEGVFGVLSVVSAEPDFFTEAHERLLASFAALASAAVREARLYQQAQQEIAARTQAEAQLREAEAKYRTLVEQLPVPTYLLAYHAGRHEVQYLSPHVAAIVGFSSSEFMAEPNLWVSRLHPDDRERVLAETGRLRASGDRLVCEYRLLARDGSVRWIRDEAVVLPREGDGPRLIQGVWADITERKRAEEQVLEAERRYRTLVEQLPAISYVAEADGRTTSYVSPQIHALLGFRPEEWIGEPRLWEQQIHPGDRERVLAEWSQAFAQGRPFVAEYRLIGREGQIVWVYDRATSAGPEERGPRRIQGVMVDITARKQAEQRAQVAAERLERLIENTGDAVITTDPSGRVLSWNRGAEQMFGWRREAVLGQQDPSVPPEVLPRLAAARQSVLRHGRAATFESERVTRAGRRLPVLVTLSAARDENSQVAGVLGILKDLSAHKRVESQARELARLQERERIAMDLHDGVIQTLYGVLLGLSGRGEAPRGAAGGDGALAWVREQVTGVIHEIRRYIDELRPGAEEQRNLEDWLGLLVAELRGSACTDARLEVQGDVGALSPAARTNLFYVAREAVSNILRHAEAHAATIRLVGTDELLTLTVRDDGRGFDPQVPRARGQGLRNMAERARAINGRLAVTSAPGRGTEVRLEMPLERKLVRARRRPARGAHAGKHGEQSRRS